MLLQKIRYLLQGDRFYADCYEYSEKKSDDEENTANKTRFDDGTMSGEAKKSSGLSYVLTSVASVAFVAQHDPARGVRLAFSFAQDQPVNLCAQLGNLTVLPRDHIAQIVNHPLQMCDFFFEFLHDPPLGWFLGS